MLSLHNLSIKSFHEALLKKEFSALEAVQFYFQHIRDNDQRINAYISLLEESALKQAETVDVKIARGEEIDILAGAPLAIKDVILIEGVPTTAASLILKNYVASYDAFIIKKLRARNAIFLGKTNLDEFAMGASTENSAFFTTKNPCDLDRVAGGSSGGSAAAVAANMALAAIGTDTGGSIRQPAAFCGVVGLKPTYGAVSRSGQIALASSLDQIGPITKTVEDAALIFDAIRGYDRMDATSSGNAEHGDLTKPELGKIRELKIGVPKEYFTEGMEEEVARGVESAIHAFKSLKVEVKKISLQYTKYGVPAYYIIMPAEASANLARYEGIRYGKRQKANWLAELYHKNRGFGFGAEPKRRIILGAFVLSSGYYDAYYEKAQRVRTLIKNDFETAFKEVDVILAPVTPTRAFKIGEKANDPLSMYLSDIFTIPVNLAGLPALALPVKSKGQRPEARGQKLPVGFQLIGRHFREEDILGLGQVYEKL